MLPYFAEVSVRVLALALIGFAFAWKRSAAVQHAVWTTVSCGMLALFAFGSALPRLPLKVLRALPEPAMPAPAKNFQPPVLIGAQSPSNGLTPTVVPASISYSVPARREIDWVALGYGAVALAFLLRFALGTFLARRLVKHSVLMGGFRESERITVPLTVGWFRREILLPLDWRDWDRIKLDAVLAHEGEHVRRRDGLIAAIAGINRSIFWFHPLAWWLERRLSLLAELACDEACVAATGDPEQYASLLIEMTQVMDVSRGRLREHALAMAGGSRIGVRIRSILKEGRRFSKGVSRMGWVAIMLGGVPLVWAAGTITLDRQAAPLPLRVPLLNTPKPPVQVAQARPAAPATKAPAPVAPAQFEVASIRPTLAPGFRDSFTMHPGRVEIANVSLQRLMEYAFRLPQKQVDGPTWLHHWGGPRFDIIAKLPQGATADQVPEMIRALLVDRFKLVYHLEHREQNIDVLAIAKGGLKLEQVEPPPAPASPADPDAPATMQTVNGLLTRVNAPSGGLADSDGFVHKRSPNGIYWEFASTTLAGLADQFAEEFQRPVVDMTGLKGRYHVVLDVKYDFSTVPPPKTIADIEDEFTDLRNHFNTELQKAGLQLEMRKLPVEYVVADKVEQKPTDN